MLKLQSTLVSIKGVKLFHVVSGENRMMLHAPLGSELIVVTLAVVVVVLLPPEAAAVVVLLADACELVVALPDIICVVVVAPAVAFELVVVVAAALFSNVVEDANATVVGCASVKPQHIQASETNLSQVIRARTRIARRRDQCKVRGLYR
jgi:hypothetical protein